jgi:hypothetical protein
MNPHLFHQIIFHSLYNSEALNHMLFSLLLMLYYSVIYISIHMICSDADINLLHNQNQRHLIILSIFVLGFRILDRENLALMYLYLLLQMLYFHEENFPPLRFLNRIYHIFELHDCHMKFLKIKQPNICRQLFYALINFLNIE